MTALGEIALFTDDVDRVTAFYCAVAGTEPVAEWPGGAQFRLGGSTLLVHVKASPPADGPPNEDHFALSVAELDATCAALADAGLTLLVEPRDFPWGRSAYLRDPDGRLVELTEG